MTAPRDPVAMGRSISDRIKARVDAMVDGIADRAEREQQRNGLTQRLRRELAFQRLLARIFGQQPDAWLLKGGIALQQRLDPSRASNDIDIARIDPAIEHELALRELRAAALVDLGDFFEFELGEPREAVDEDRAIKVPVIARVGRQRFAQFDVDVAPAKAGTSSDIIQPNGPNLGIEVLDAMPPLRLIALEQQVADKVCAMFELHGEAKRPSARSRDLGDLAMLAAQCEFDGSVLTDAVRREEARRRDGLLTHGLSGRIELAPEQLCEWPRTWTKQARDPQFDFDESLQITKRFLDPVLAGEAVGRRWSLEQGWRAP